LKGAFKRVMAGMPILMTEASGPGQIAFSRDGAGHVFAIHLNRGEGIEMREHQFLAATGSIEYTFTRVKGVSNMLMGGTGFFIDHFIAQQSEGIVWVHGYGNVFDVTLGAGEQIDVEPGGWVYKDRSAQMETQFQRFSAGLFASGCQINKLRTRTLTKKARLLHHDIYQLVRHRDDAHDVLAFKKRPDTLACKRTCFEFFGYGSKGDKDALAELTVDLDDDFGLVLLGEFGVKCWPRMLEDRTLVAQRFPKLLRKIRSEWRQN
jgi:hypothetical protein